RWQRHQAMAERIGAWVEARDDLSLLADSGRRSPTVTAIRLKPPHSALDVAEKMLRLGWEIGASEEDQSGEILRVGHMGELTSESVGQLLAALQRVLGE